jgi:serine protease Do
MAFPRTPAYRYTLLLLLGFAPAAWADTAKLPPPPVALDKAAPESVEDLKAIQEHVKLVLAKVIPCTVGVRVGAAQGSGVIVKKDDGYFVLTAGHVSGQPDRDVTLLLADGTKLKGKTRGANRGIDSGLIQIVDEGTWPAVEMGKSKNLKKGQWCVTVGHPGGFKPDRTPVVRLGRVLDSTASVIRTDCTLVGGDSGGPLFDMHGKVIGIHSRIAGPITANMHVPVDTYGETWDRLAKGESWGTLFGIGGRRPPDPPAYLGIQGGEDAKVLEVVAGSPAEKAGFKVNDVVTKFDGSAVGTLEELGNLIRKKKPGDKVTVEVRRGSETVALKVELGRRES